MELKIGNNIKDENSIAIIVTSDMEIKYFATVYHAYKPIETGYE